jgi:UDP-glucose 4-epimerase
VKVLVTGGAGYIGSVVAARLVESGHQVVVLDDLSTGHAGAVPDGAVFERGGAQDAADILDASYDGVLHFAAKSLVGESVADPGLYWRRNLSVSVALLDAMRARGVPRIVFSSTAAVYGEPEVIPITEDTVPSPINPYGETKLAVDHALRGYARAHGLGAVSLRYFNVAGAYGRHGERHDPETHLIPNVLRVATGERDAVEVFGTDYPTRDGTAVRDYIHVVDLADAHLLALDACTPGHRIYNLGSARGSTVREVIDAARAVTGHPIPEVERPRRAGDPPVLVASHARIAGDLGWKPTRDLAQTIADAYAFVASTSSRQREQGRLPSG